MASRTYEILSFNSPRQQLRRKSILNHDRNIKSRNEDARCTCVNAAHGSQFEKDCDDLEFFFDELSEEQQVTTTWRAAGRLTCNEHTSEGGVERLAGILLEERRDWSARRMVAMAKKGMPNPKLVVSTVTGVGTGADGNFVTGHQASQFSTLAPTTIATPTSSTHTTVATPDSTQQQIVINVPAHVSFTQVSPKAQFTNIFGNEDEFWGFEPTTNEDVHTPSTNITVSRRLKGKQSAQPLHGLPTPEATPVVTDSIGASQSRQHHTGPAPSLTTSEISTLISRHGPRKLADQMATPSKEQTTRREAIEPDAQETDRGVASGFMDEMMVNEESSVIMAEKQPVKTENGRDQQTGKVKASSKESYCWSVGELCKWAAVVIVLWRLAFLF